MSEYGTTPPVKEGDVIESKCISIGKKGDGIFKHDNFIIVVPDTEVDQTYTIEITKVLSKMAFGTVEE